MGKFVQPKVFLVGYTEAHYPGIQEYLEYTKQTEFLDDIRDARNAGISAAECLCSMFAKLCYKSIVEGKNANVNKIRSIENNVKGTWDTSHGSVFEHAGINFLITDCSRVFTHELVRHRAGTAFSQTSGRYCRLDSIDLVLDPVLEPIRELLGGVVEKIEDTVYLAECKLGLRKPPNLNLPHPDYSVTPEMCLNARDEGKSLWESFRWVPDMSFDMDKRKKMTSAIRRIAPNGQSNEIGFTVNVRALRHFVQLRTAPSAEWEIRCVAAQMYNLTRSMFPLLWYKAKTKIVDNVLYVYGMKSNPYDITPGDPNALQFWSTSQLEAELSTRNAPDVSPVNGPQAV